MGTESKYPDSEEEGKICDWSTSTSDMRSWGLNQSSHITYLKIAYHPASAYAQKSIRQYGNRAFAAGPLHG